MVRGIGVDMVDVREIARFIAVSGDTFVNRTFTTREVIASKEAPNQAEYLATRFAAKEAVFKAIAHNTGDKGFDLRIVETLNESDGFPYINVSGELRALLDEAGVGSLLVSISTEGDFVIAFVLAVSEREW